MADTTFVDKTGSINAEWLNDVNDWVYSGTDPTGTNALGNKTYTDSRDALLLPLTGGTVTGQIKGITPVADADLTRKDYVDTKYTQSAKQTLNTETSVTFGGIPSWAKRVTIHLNNSTYSSAFVLSARIGDAAGIESDATYFGLQSYITGTNLCDIILQNGDTEWDLTGGLGTVNWVNGKIVFERTSPDTDLWSITSEVVSYNSTAATKKKDSVHGMKLLSDTLTQVQLITTGAWSGGSASMTYEG